MLCSVIQEAWCSVVRDSSHRPKHCCASIEDPAYWRVNLHLAACCSYVGRSDDGGLGAVLLLRCCVLFVLAVVVAVVSFLLVSLCLLARVGVLGHRRGTALGHPCGMPPTGADIAVLLLKTWLAPDSTYTYQPSAVGLSVGMLAVRAVLYCCAVLCCCCRSCC